MQWVIPLNHSAYSMWNMFFFSSLLRLPLLIPSRGFCFIHAQLWLTSVIVLLVLFHTVCCCWLVFSFVCLLFLYTLFASTTSSPSIAVLRLVFARHTNETQTQSHKRCLLNRQIGIGFGGVAVFFARLTPCRALVSCASFLHSTYIALAHSKCCFTCQLIWFQHFSFSNAFHFLISQIFGLTLVWYAVFFCLLSVPFHPSLSLYLSLFLAEPRYYIFYSFNRSVVWVLFESRLFILSHVLSSASRVLLKPKHGLYGENRVSHIPSHCRIRFYFIAYAVLGVQLHQQRSSVLETRSKLCV